MKKLLVVAMALIGTGSLFSQDQAKVDYSQDWLKQALDGQYLDATEQLPGIAKHELSKLWVNVRFLGFIGEDYQRFHIHFLSIIKNEDNPRQYLVYGKSRVRDNTCEFLGTIELLHARKYKESMVDTVTQGILIIAYEFFENQNQRHAGSFKGIATTHWYMNKNGDLKYDDLSVEADGYCNNEFVGVWTSYDAHRSKTCHWGEYRIPLSGDLDVGTCEFAPNEKYLKNGWENYDKAYGHGDKEALQLEDVEWWK